MSENAPPPDPRLAQTLAFSEHELINNRRGLLTSAQRLRLVAVYRRAVLPWALLATVLILGWASSFWLVTAEFALLSGLVGLLPVMLALLWQASRINRPFAQDVEDGRAAQVIGEWILHPNTGRLVLRDAQFGEHILYLPADAHTIFADGVFYRVYFAPHTRVVLAAEPIRAP
ncbi:MAG: hypothetical protein ACLFTK_13930 [Anaerolineales bacterium]